MANATSTQLQELYVAYFGRAADPTGLDYWTEKGITQAAFAADMYAQAEFKDAYGSLSTESQVNTIYKNLFDREADVSGLTYWTQQVNLGVLKIAEIATHLIWAAQNNSGSANDKTALSNKTTAAIAYTAKVKETTAGILAYAAESTSPWVSGANITEAKSYLSGIDKDTAHTAAGVAASVTTITTNGVQADKKTFNLTSDLNTFIGADGNDTFVADNSGTDVLTAGDVLTGGLGTDTLKVYSDGSTGKATLTNVTGIETFSIFDENDALDISGVTDFTTANWTRGDGITTLTIGAGVTGVTLKDIDLGETGFILAHATTDTTAVVTIDDVLIGGTTGDEDININGTSLTSTTLNVTTASTTDVFDVAGSTSIAINATGAFTAGSMTTSGDAATLTVTGAGAVGLGTLDSDINTVTATSATGALTFKVAADNADFVANLGSGNDVVSTSDDGWATTDAFNVDAGAGTGDVLVVTAASDLNLAAEGARYDNFEVIRTANSQDVSLVSGITSVQLTAATATTISGLNATNLAGITFQADNATSTTFTGSDVSGTTDSITIHSTSATATTTVDLIGISVVGIETVNFHIGSGSTASTAATSSALGFLANTSDEVTAINITGTSDAFLTVAANTLDIASQSVTIDASGMTGNADLTLTETSSLITGSTVTGTANGDTITLGTNLGNTYNTGAGNDTLSTVLANLVADGTDDTIFSMAAGTDTVQINDAAATLTDNHFTNVTGAEKLTLAGTGSTSVTTGGGFTAAFTDSATITVGALADTKTLVIAAGLYNKALTVDASNFAADGNAAAEDVTITTGDGADTVTLTATAFVGAANGCGSISIDTDAGVDTITVTTGTIVASTKDEILTINAGTGADVINLTTICSSTATSAANIVVDAGDSLVTAWDTIDGFDMATGLLDGMTLDFTGTSAASDFTNSNDYGTIKSHSLAIGVATFDDAASHTTALIINSTNIADVVGYLQANTDTLDTVAFVYDSTNNNAADATMVYNNNTTDSLVLLKTNATAAGVTATLTTNIANYVCIA